MIEVDGSANGRRVVLQAGQLLRIGLPENPSTGFQWRVPTELKSKLTPVLLEQEDIVQAPNGPPGSSGIRYLNFEAAAPGATDLEIHYRRSWEPDRPPARKFKIHVIVRPVPRE